MSSNVKGGTNQNEIGTTRSLDACIYDFLQKSSLNNTASAFVQETGIDGASGYGFGTDVPQGFLYEWWQIFWDLFNAKAHHEGSMIAKQYYQILAEQQRKEYGYRSAALQAARMQFLAEENGELNGERIDPAAFSMHAGVYPHFPVAPTGSRNESGSNGSYSASASAGGNFSGGIGLGSFPVPAGIPFMPLQGFANISGRPVYANQCFPVVSNDSHTAAVTTPGNVKTSTTTIATPITNSVSNNKQPGLKRRASTNTNNVTSGTNDFKCPKVSNSTHSTPYESQRGLVPMNKSNPDMLHNYQRQFAVLESENIKKSSPSPLSNGFSATTNNTSNQNNEHGNNNSGNNNSGTNNSSSSNSSNSNNGAIDKKNMQPPYASMSPYNVPTLSPNTQNGTNNSNQSKSISSRTKSISNVIIPSNRSTQNTISENSYFQYSPVTPMTVNSSNDIASCNSGKNVHSSLSTVTEVLLTNSPNNSPDITATNKKVRKVRSSKKSKQSPTNNQNGNFKFISSNSVPTPPNESSQKSQYRIFNKNQTKKNTTSTVVTAVNPSAAAALASKSNKLVSKSSTEESPQLIDDNSSTTPTFLNAMWNANGKTQTASQANFSFVGDTISSAGAASSLVNTDNTLGCSSSSAVSNHFSENEADDLLAMKSILAIQDSHDTESKNILSEESDVKMNHHQHDNNNHTEFNLDLLEPSDTSFHYLGWQNEN